jgi:LPXTG-site transpeptidase (sortase) family protein
MVKRRRRVHYRHGEKLKSYKWQRIGTVIAVVLILAGGYLLYLLQTPSSKPLSASEQKAFIPEEVVDKRIIIPKIGAKADIFEGDTSILDKGAWHRLPELGDPESGGNFILSGHRYVLAATPAKTKEASYFYNLDKLVEGDTILVDWHQKRHVYKVTKLYTVKPTQLSIESPSKDPKLTLYTCTLKGASDGRVVIEAVPAQ